MAADLRLTEILRANPFTVVAEVVSARQVQPITAAGAQVLSVVKGAGENLSTACLVSERFRKPCITHFTARDLLPSEIEKDLLSLHSAGIRNILAVKGDPEIGGPWLARAGSHTYAYQLVEQIRALREGPQFCVGVACYPDHENPPKEIEYFHRKADAGADFAITQIISQVDSYARYLEASTARGIAIPILPGIFLARTKEAARKASVRFEAPIADSYIRNLPDHPDNLDQALDAFILLADGLRAAGAPGLQLFFMGDTEMAVDALGRLATV